MANSDYNAESAWNYLGAGTFDGRGAYDYSRLPSYKNIFDLISNTQINPRRSSPIDDMVTFDTAYNTYARSLPGVNAPEFSIDQVYGLLDRFTPQKTLNRLAGRYMYF